MQAGLLRMPATQAASIAGSNPQHHYRSIVWPQSLNQCQQDQGVLIEPGPLGRMGAAASVHY